MTNEMNYSEFVALCRGEEKIALTKEEKDRIRESRKAFEEVLRTDAERPYYGINTGVGALLNKRVPANRMKEFQENLIMSHACGIGPALENEIAKGMMLHMILNLKKGCSVIRLSTLELLIEMFNRDIIPRVPGKGSLGASGDLIPQAHIALALIGRGDVLCRDSSMLLPSESVFQNHGLKSAELEVGEAIALLNGTSLMTSYLAFLVFQADILVETADTVAASTTAILGYNSQSFEDQLHSLRPHPGQIATALNLRNILKRKNAERRSSLVQDAYSLRCIPQVHGAFREALYRARDVANIEINSFGGNPLILFEGKKPRIVQGSGNFHGQILAQTADSLSIALCGLAGISERRIERLLNDKLSGLPPFLAKTDGLNTGLMIAQYTAAALVSENKTLAHPASVDSIPVSAGQEDFVSMGAWAVRKAWEILKNTEYVIAIEALCAAQASQPEKDRVLSEDIEKTRRLIHKGGFLDDEANC